MRHSGQFRDVFRRNLRDSDLLGWVLVTDGATGQNRSTLAAVRALATAGYRAALTLSTGRSIASVSRFCDRVVPAPLVDDPGYADAVRAETDAHPYLTVLPTSDAALQALDAPGKHLCDKSRLAVLAREAGLQVPPGRDFDDAHSLRAAADDLGYPIVVKPTLRTGERHLPAQRFDTAEQVRRAPDMPGPLLVQPMIRSGMHSIAGVMWQGELKAAVHQTHERIWPRQCGDACYAVTTAPDPALERGLRTMLADYNGIFQAEFTGPYLLDLNPRVYGSLPLAVSAGANPVGVYCDLLRGVDVPPVRARPGVEYHWWGGDVRHIASRWQSGEIPLAEAARALRVGQALTWENVALRDPRPALERWRYTSRLLGARLAGLPAHRAYALPGRDLSRPEDPRSTEE